MRHSRGLLIALEEFGRSQSEWYEAIFDLDIVYFNKYCGQEDFRDYLTGPFEMLTKLKSPETLAGLPPDKQPSSLIELDRVKNYYQFYPDSQRSICELLETRHLAGHQNCLRLLNEMIRYPDGEEMIVDLCPMSLAYLILRVKNIYERWPTPGSTSITVAGLGELYPEGYTSDQIFNYRSAVLAFLSILGELQYHISKGCNFIILCQYYKKSLITGERRCAIFKRTSYSFRSMCRSPAYRVRLFRDGVGGPVLVMVEAGRCSPDGFARVKRVIF